MHLGGCHKSIVSLRSCTPGRRRGDGEKMRVVPRPVRSPAPRQKREIRLQDKRGKALHPLPRARHGTNTRRLERSASRATAPMLQVRVKLIAPAAKASVGRQQTAIVGGACPHGPRNPSLERFFLTQRYGPPEQRNRTGGRDLIEGMGDWKRSRTLGELRLQNEASSDSHGVGAPRRDHGGLIFLDLRTERGSRRSCSTGDVSEAHAKAHSQRRIRRSGQSRVVRRLSRRRTRILRRSDEVRAAEIEFSPLETPCFPSTKTRESERTYG